MAKPKKERKKVFQGSKSRTILIAMVVIVIVGLIIAFVHLFGGSSPASSGSASISSVPGQIQSVPGGTQESQQYLKTLLQSNKEQAAAALKRGQSEIGTLVASPSQGTSTAFSAGKNPSAALCPCDTQSTTGAPTSNDLINQFLGSGKISQGTATALRALGTSNLSPADYAEKVDQLAKEGKITPAEARQLISAYNKAHGVGGSNTSSETPNAVISRLLGNGKISQGTAAALRTLGASDLSPADYAKKIDQLAAEGKLTPAEAKQLEAAYDQAQGALTPDALVKKLQTSGKISQGTADALKALDASGLSPADYAKKVDQLAAEGKLTPAEANALKAAYSKAHGTGVGAGTDTTTQQSAATPTTPNGIVSALEKSGAIDATTANQLKHLNTEGLSPTQYAKKLNALVQAGKLSPAAAHRLLAAYATKAAKFSPSVGQSPDGVVSALEAQGRISPATAKTLKALNAEGLTPREYAKKLGALVRSGDLTPGEAQSLLSAYNRHYAKAQKGLSGSGVAGATTVGSLEHSGAIDATTAGQLRSLASQGITSSAYGSALQNLVNQGKLTPDQAKKLLQAYELQHGDQGSLKGTSTLAKLQAQQQQASTKDLEGNFNKQQQALNAQQKQALQKQLQQLEGRISGQSKDLFKAWASPQQRLVGALATKSEKTKSSSSSSSSNAKESGKSAAAKGPSMIKAGAILFATLNTSINSDRPGPVMATIVAGKYKGAKLLGTLQTTSDYQRVVLTFNTMSMPNWPSTVGINAVAINPDTARTALASNVDNHYLLRYSALFASSFMQGIGSAVQNSGQTTVNNAGTTSQTFSNLSTGEKVLVGLGQVGKSAGSAAQKVFNKHPTVTVMAGVGLGILYTKDVAAPSFLTGDDKSQQKS